jgi:hypothetical protein
MHRPGTKKPSLFKERDVSRAIRGARAAGATRVSVAIDKLAVIHMDLELGENGPAGNGDDPWDRKTEELAK